MKLTNCNCGKQVDCGCTVSFDTFQNNTVSVLSVGNLIGGSCSLDEYVIDWYRNGEHALVSGKGNDPQIQAFHPFTGNAAIPVPPGNWKPVLRYVVINGSVIYPAAKKCKDFCLALDTQLPSIAVPHITVSALNCSSRVGSPASGYDVRFQYQTTQDYSLASRTVHFYLDATTWAFAVAFTAALVADRVRVTHSRTGHVYGDFIVGQNGVVCQYSAMPNSIYLQSAFRFAFYTPDYQDGDYFIIEVFPSVLENNPNTIWTLDLKCIKTGSFPLDMVQDSMREYDIDSLSFVFEEEACRFRLSLDMASSPPIWSGHYLGTYCGMGALAQNSYWYSGGKAGLYHNSSRTPLYTNYFDSGYSTKITISGSISTTKAGNVYTWVCSDAADYNALRDGYNRLMASGWASDFVNDPANVKYYKYHVVNWTTAANGCGDNEVSASFYFHRSSLFTWDDQARTITVTAASISNNHFFGCDAFISQINSIVSLCTTTITRADFSSVTKCRTQSPFSYGTGMFSATMPSNSATGGLMVFFYGDKSTPGPVDGTWCFNNCHYGWQYFYFRTVITASRDGNGNWINPTENFEVYRLYDIQTGCYSVTGFLIYKKVDGVITVKKSYYQE